MNKMIYIFVIDNIIEIASCGIALGDLFILYLIIFVSPLRKHFVFRQQITKTLFVKQHPFRNKYYLTDNTGRILLDGIITWMITKDYVYGYCCNRRCEWYIFNRKNGDRFFYKEHRQFTETCSTLSLPEYTTDSYNNPDDFIQKYVINKFPIGALE